MQEAQIAPPPLPQRSPQVARRRPPQISTPRPVRLPQPIPEKTRLWPYQLVILLAGFLAFARVLNDYFVMDDFQLLERASRTAWWEAFRTWPSFEGLPFYWLAPLGTNSAREPAYFRPLQGLIYWASYHTWGMHSLPYHLVSLTLHLVVSVLVFHVALLFTRRVPFAAMAGVLFAVHPSHTEAIQWVAAVSDPLAALFVLLGFSIWYREHRRGNRKWTAQIVPLVCYGLAMLCKESSVVLPLLLLATALLPEPETDGVPVGQRLLRRFRDLAPFWIATVAYVLIHMSSTSGLHNGTHGSAYLHSVTERGFVPYALFDYAVYLWSLVVPVPLFPIDVREVIPSLPIIAGAAVVLLLLLAALARKCLRNVPGGAFYALWPAIAILPCLPVALGQRFLYLPSAGVCWAFALVLERAWERRESRVVPVSWKVGLAALVLAAIGLANVHQAVWGIPGDVTRTLVRDIRRQAPTVQRGSEIYLLNLWAPSVRLPDAVRLEYGDPTLKVEVLTCSPKTLPLRSGQSLGPVERLFAAFVPEEYGASHPAYRWSGPDRLRVAMDRGERFGNTLVEGMLPTKPPVSGATQRGHGFIAAVDKADDRGVEEVEFRFDRQPGRERRFFECRDARFHAMEVPGALSATNLSREADHTH